MFVLDALAFQARSRPHDPAVLGARNEVPYGQLLRLVERAAGRIRDLGLGRDLPVAIYLSDPLLHLLVLLALMREGVPSFSAHPNHDPPPAGLALGAYVADRALPHMAGTPTVTADLSWLAERPGAVPEARPFAGDHALVRVYASSGTTGLPKAVPVTLSMLRARIAEDLTVGIYRGERFLPSVAPATSFGLRRRLAGLMTGQTLVLGRPDGRLAMPLERHAVTEARVSVAQLQTLLDELGVAPRPLPALEHVTISGSSIAPAVAVAARVRLGASLHGVYGSTETGTMAVAPGRLLTQIPGCAGYPLPSVSVQVVDEAGRPLPPGAEGIVRIRSPGMASGYLGDLDASETAFRDGWFHPGDVGALREDGLLVLSGRASEVINAGGVKVSPELINAVLAAEPGIVEAAAFGVEPPGRAAQIWAAVVAAVPIDEPALLAACRARLGSRSPTKILRLERLPRNQNGKVMADELRRLALDGLQGDPA